MKKVAICIPGYNNPHSMKCLLDSIKEQTYRNFIVVLTDDSEDDSILNLVNNYPMLEIVYIKNDLKLGSTKNTNRAIKISKQYNPHYIKIMHHDDFFSQKESLEKMVNMLERNPQVNMAFSGTVQVSDTESFARFITDIQYDQLVEDYRILYTGNVIGAPSAVLIRNLDIYLDDKLLWFVDTEWYMRILYEKPIFKFTKEPLISIGISDKQLTRSCENNYFLMLEEYIYIYNKLIFLQEKKYMNYLLEKVLSNIKIQKIIEFCKNAKKIYIYGAGIIGERCTQYLQTNNIKIEGFLVSDGMKTHKKFLGHKVFEVSELERLNLFDFKVIIALNSKNQQEILKQVNKLKVDYMFFE